MYYSISYEGQSYRSKSEPAEKSVKSLAHELFADLPKLVCFIIERENGEHVIFGAEATRRAVIHVVRENSDPA